MKPKRLQTTLRLLSVYAVYIRNMAHLLGIIKHTSNGKYRRLDLLGRLKLLKQLLVLVQQLYQILSLAFGKFRSVF